MPKGAIVARIGLGSDIHLRERPRTNIKGTVSPPGRKIDVSSEGLSSGVSSGGPGNPRVFLYELIQKHHVTK